jgi:serine/threonine protein kinase/tetratricopeptide (TPR) repeat protein
MIGKKISHYKIIEQLGAGGMGVVYKAEDTRLRRTVALKFLPPELTRDPDAKARFIREAQAASSLDQPNICNIHEIDETEDGQLFIVMACYEGETLKDKIKDTKFKTEDAISIAIQIAQGLARAHEEGIVHRDIKSTNIIITNRDEVKILDFGLAKLAGQAQLTKDSSTLGTVAYMSPEQVSGKELDQHTDIWSLGVVLYEMLTGKLPFKGEYEQAVIYGILNDEPNFSENIQPKLQNIVKKSLMKNKDDRFDTIAEFLVDLEQIKNALHDTQSGKRSPSKTESFLKNKYAITSAIIIIALTIFIFIYFNQTEQTIKESSLKRLVVLPFENLGASEDEYFADGITEEITSRLSLLHGLGVISRSSAVHYKNTKKTVKQIGEELEVDYVLEGTVRWDKSADKRGRVIVTPQLIRVSDDIHLWSDSYNRQIESIFDVQATIADEVIKALDITVLEPEREELYQKPTDKLEAYDLFIRAREIMYKYYHRELAKLDSAIQLFEKAIKIDNNLVMAYVWISEIHSWLYHVQFDYTDERQAKSKEAIDKALEMQPGLPEAKLYLGWYWYRVFRDYDRARKLFNEVKKRRPNEPPRLLAAIERRQGNWDKSAHHWEESFRLDPRRPRMAREVGTTYKCMREYNKAESWYQRYQVIVPTDEVTKGFLAECFILKNGNIKAAQSILNTVKRIDISYYETLNTLILLDLVNKKYNKALNIYDSLRIAYSKGQHFFLDKYYIKAYIYNLLGDRSKSQQYADSSVILIKNEMKINPNDPRYHSALGLAFAFRGKKSEAISSAKRAMDIYPVSLDAVDGPNYVYNLAWTYTIVGEEEKAINQLKYLLSIPAGMVISKAMLKIDPKWNTLHDNARFQELIK